MFKKYIFLIAFVIAVVIQWEVFRSQTPFEMVTIKGEDFAVMVANTQALREQGLSGREALGDTEGMLFVFPDEGGYGFWMKDMRFSLDILWIDSEYTIIDIDFSVAPETYPEVFYPALPVRYVLELPSGASERYGIVRGDVVQFKNIPSARD